MKQSPSNLPATRRCAIYTRKSTSVGLEMEFNSLDAQREACEAYVARMPGWKVLPTRYDDGGFTGANLERPAFRRLVADCEAGLIDIVVVYKVDRLSRSLLDFSQVMDRLNRSGAAFVSVTQNFSTADAMGRLTLNMLMSFAEFEREMIGERTRDKIGASRRKGKWTGGTVPMGYTVVAKKLKVDVAEAGVVREVFALYEQHPSALRVARQLNATGMSTKRHVSAGGNVRPSRPWGKNDVLRVLRCALYAGLVSSGGQLHPGEHEPIITRALFDRVQARLKRNARELGQYTRNPDYLLVGLLRCRCGAAMTSASSFAHGRRYRYYRCAKRSAQGDEACPARQLPADAIESYVVDRIRQATADGNFAVEVAEKAQMQVAERRKALSAERAKLPTLIAKLTTEGEKLVESLSTVKGTAKTMLEGKIERLGTELGLHETRLAEVDRQLSALSQVEIESRWVATLLRDFDPVWDALTPENRGRLVRAVVERVEVDEAENKIRIVMADLDGAADQQGAAA
jgi:site-specific DNA recombinase